MKKLRETTDEEIDQETRKAKMDKESAIKQVMKLCLAAGRTQTYL